MLFAMTLASKYRVIDIITGIVTAVILLNILAVTVGAGISKVLPDIFLDIISGICFLIFAFLSLKVEQEDSKDNLKTGAHIPFVSIAALLFISELGDKTQLYTIALSAANPQGVLYIFAGSTIGLLLSDAIGIVVGRNLGKMLPENLIKRIAFLLFSFFGLMALREPLIRFIGEKAAISAIIASGLFLVYILFKTAKKDKDRALF